MTAKSRALAKRKKKTGRPVAAKAKARPVKAPPVKRPRDLAAAAAGLEDQTSERYFQPVNIAKHVMYKITRDKEGNVLSADPFVRWEGILDNLHRRGLQEIETTELSSRSCKEAGCYNGGEEDRQIRFRTRITLVNGQVFTGHGEACRHNSTKVTARALPRLAETRSKARAGRDATNIGMTSIVELDPRGMEFRDGKDRIMSQEEVHVAASGGNKKTEPAKPALPAPQEPVQPEKPKEQVVDVDAKDYSEDPEWKKASGALHIEQGRLKFNKVGLHRYMHGFEKVGSLRNISPERIWTWANRLKGFKEDSAGADRLRKQLENEATKKGDNDG